MLIATYSPKLASPKAIQLKATSVIFFCLVVIVVSDFLMDMPVLIVPRPIRWPF